MTPRTVSTVAALAAGIAAGSASSSVTWRATPIGSRKPPISRSRSVAGGRRRRWCGAASIVAGSSGGGSGASRSKSRNCSDICTPPSPSVIVWCIFCTSADLPPRKPVDDDELPQRAGALERVERDQRGQVEQLAQRARLGQGDVADVVVDVEVGIVDPHRRRRG